MALRIRTLDLRPFAPALRAVSQAAFRGFIRRAAARAKTDMGPRFDWLARTVESRVTVHGLRLRGVLAATGRTRPHLIRPKRPLGVLHFELQGEDIFTRLVHHPGGPTPAPRYLTGALRAEVPTFEAELDAGATALFQRLARARLGAT